MTPDAFERFSTRLRDNLAARPEVLDLAEARLGADPAFPTRAAAAVRCRLDWSDR